MRMSDWARADGFARLDGLSIMDILPTSALSRETVAFV